MSALTSLYQEIARCQGCQLSKTRSKVVPGEGAEDSSIVFIGEAPGFNEDQQGRPFVGAAGHFLEELLASISLKRESVYICNVIKCRPPDNRDPLPIEIKSCQKWLNKQLDIIQPKIIVTLGRHSMARYFPGETISKVHGQARICGDLIYFPMYHPAAALHQPGLRNTIKNDMLKIPPLIAQFKKTPKIEPEPKQLNLF